jgi:hypothetical protein
MVDVALVKNVRDPINLNGEVVYELAAPVGDKKLMKRFIHKDIDRHLQHLVEPLHWASYLVIFSPGQEAEEVRCQVDIETNGDRAGFSVGYGLSPHHAFGDAVDRLQWFEKNKPVRMSV